MKNSIAERISDFLKGFPPFNLLKEKHLMEIASEVTIIYLEKGDTLYNRTNLFTNIFILLEMAA
jgi:CBS domain-containing protein